MESPKFNHPLRALSHRKAKQPKSFNAIYLSEYSLALIFLENTSFQFNYTI